MAQDVASAAPSHGAHGSLSRRRMLTGAAWATPVVLVGLAAPAAASSPPDPAPPAPLSEGTGVQNGPNSNHSTATYESRRWYADASTHIKAVVLADYIQNLGNNAPQTTGLTLTLTAPVVGVTSLDWGVATNSSGIASGQPWMLGSASLSGNTATLVLIYTGAPLGPWGGVQIPNIWFRTGSDPRPASATFRVDATYVTGQQSTHTRAVPVS
mgnify:CR=1 FL=1